MSCQDDLWGAEHPGGAGTVANRGPLAARGEGHRLHVGRGARISGFPGILEGLLAKASEITEPLPDGIGGGVGLPHRTEKCERREHLGGRLVAVGTLDLSEADTAGGNGAGLIQAQGIDPGQDLDGGQLLNQDVAPGQGQGGGGEVDGGQEHQALGHHADHAGDTGNDRVPPGTAAPGLGDASAQPQLGPHQYQGHGHDDPADPVQHPIGPRLQLTDNE